MAAGCQDVSIADGGIFTNGTVANCTVQGSVVNGSAISASSLNTVTGVDGQTARVIAEAVAQLPVEELRELAKAIAEAMPVIEPALGPERTQGATLPTEVAGGRRYLLGAPNGWLTMRGVVVPAYLAQE